MKMIAGFLLAAFILPAFTGCSKDNAGNNNGYTKKQITINCGLSYGSVIMQTIRVMELLPPLLPSDVTVEWDFTENSADIRDAAIAGNIDIMSLSASSAISAIENGLPLRLVSGQVAVSAKMFSLKDTIRSVSDLPPHSKITVSSKGSSPHFAFALLCKDVFGDPTIFEETLVPVPNVDAIGLIQTSQDYDAFILTFPTYLKIPANLNYHLVNDITQTSVKYNMGTYIMTSDSFAKNNPVIIEAFRKAGEQAVNLLLNNTDEVSALLTEFYGVDAASIAETIRQCPPKLEMSGYDDIAAVMLEMGILSKPPKKFSELPNYSEIPRGE